MKITALKPIVMRWDTFTLPIKAGTPVNIYGTLANDGNAIGIIPQEIKKVPDLDAAYILTGGSVDLSELGYDSLSDAAMRAMSGISFYGADGTPEADPVYVVPEASTTTAGIVKMAANVADAEGDAPTAAEFKALLDALKEAGIMEPDADDT